MKNLITLQLLTLVSSPELVIKVSESTIRFKALIQLQAKNCNHPGHEHLHDPQYLINDYEDIYMDDELIPNNPMAMTALNLTFASMNIQLSDYMENATNLWIKENINMPEFRHIYRELQKLVELKECLLEVDDQDFDYLASIQKR